MKRIIFFLLSLAALNLPAQSTEPLPDLEHWQPPYELPVPEGWGVERFHIPISFAPDIPYKGVEDLRFAPGFTKPASDNYWTYAYLWFLEGKVKINAKKFRQHLQDYYTGLLSVNASDIPADKLIPVEAQISKTGTSASDDKSFLGTLQMNNYLNHQPLTLNCKIHLKFSPDQKHTFIFFELSPQPFSHAAWKGPDQLWTDFKWTKE